MNKEKEMKENIGWRAVILAIVLTATPLLIAYAISSGSVSNQTQTNKESIEKLEIRFDEYQKNQIQMIQDLGEIKGYIKAQSNE
jgi:hypothetical protein